MAVWTPNAMKVGNVANPDLVNGNLEYLKAESDNPKNLIGQCVNLARTTNGQADFLGAGTGLKARILASSTNLVGNGQYKDNLSKFSFNTDFDTTETAIANRRSTLMYKNWSTTGAFDYTNQRPQWGNTFDVSKNLLMDFSSSLTLDKYGNTVTVLGNPTLSGDKYVGDGTGDGLKITSIVSLGSGMWCIEGKFKFNNTNASMSLIEGINGSYYSVRLIRNSSNRLELYASSNSSTYNIANVVLGSKADWSTSTEYYIKLKFTGTQYIASWSTDGITYTDDLTVTSSLNIAGFDSNGLVFGIDGFNNTLSFNGTMDDLRVTIGNTRADGEAFTADAYWFDTANKIMKYGSPANWVELPECVALGEVVTNASGVVSAVSYALNRYVMFKNVAPAVGAKVFQTNMGIKNYKYRIIPYKGSVMVEVVNYYSGGFNSICRSAQDEITLSLWQTGLIYSVGATNTTEAITSYDIEVFE